MGSVEPLIFYNITHGKGFAECTFPVFMLYKLILFWILTKIKTDYLLIRNRFRIFDAENTIKRDINSTLILISHHKTHD